jgi:transposase
MTQPGIAEVMGVSLSTVNRAHMAYDSGGVKALNPIFSTQRKKQAISMGA